MRELAKESEVLEQLAASLQIQPPSVELISVPLFAEKQLTVYMLRLDKLHAVVSGNKWYKLKFNILQALKQNSKTIITFGGAWSNHLHAFSYVGRALGLKTVAVIRGDEWQQKSNPLLNDIAEWGTELRFVSRAEYRRRYERDYQRLLCRQYPNSYLLPEGGDDYFGVLGVASLVNDLSEQDRELLAQTQTVGLACGTGNTLVGMRLALPARQRVLGFAALKGDWFAAMISRKMAGVWPLQLANWRVLDQFHEGGFAKVNGELKDWMVGFEAQTGVPLDPVYTAKLLKGVVHLAAHDFFPVGHRLLVVHTGGLQGRRSLGINSQ